MEPKKDPTVKLIAIGISVLIGIILLLNAFVIIGAGHVGVITRLGAVQRVANPGFSLKVPLIEGINQMETRVQKEQVDAGAASQDLQEVKSTVALNYHLDASHAVDVYQTIGIDYVDRVIAPAMQEAFKATTAKFTAEQLIGQREAVKTMAFSQLKDRLEPSHIIVDNFNIVNFDFSQEFNAAIESKQVAQQNVEKEKQVLASIAVQADQKRTEAKGTADAQKTLKDTGSLSPEYLQYLALTKWNGILPTVTGGGTPFIQIPNK